MYAIFRSMSAIIVDLIKTGAKIGQNPESYKQMPSRFPTMNVDDLDGVWVEYLVKNIEGNQNYVTFILLSRLREGEVTTPTNALCLLQRCKGHKAF